MKRFVFGLVIALVLTASLSPAITPVHGQEGPPPVPETIVGTNDAEIETNIDPDAASQLLSAAATNVYLPLVRGAASGSPGSFTPGAGWPMVAANPARTSWTSDTATGNLRVVWYRPIEAYISQNVQLIASDGLILVSTARGLYALNPVNGATVWRYDTELPLGNSPTVQNGIVYVGGYDRKLHALNVRNGAHLWEYAGAAAGFDTNPLVVNGRVFMGNRDGYMYAIGAHGAARQGQLLWRYKTDGPIHYSAAHKDGVVYFASNDNYGYALNADTGALVWKSDKLPGDGYHSFWPVIFQDKVIFSAAHGYRMEMDPGTYSVVFPNGGQYASFNRLQLEGIFPTDPDNALVGPNAPAQTWANGYPVIDVGKVAEYYEANPDGDPYKHKPWRRTTIVLELHSGREFTFDSDRDGYAEYAPISHWGTGSGNRYPPIVGPDNMLYANTIYQNRIDALGRVMGWNIGTKYMNVVGLQGALAEPQALSGGGTIIYRSICCDRVGSLADTRSGGHRPLTMWSYDLDSKAPGYDQMWTILPGLPRLFGWYKGNTNSINGIYHNHGDQNPMIPYGGMLFIHRSNAIIALGTGTPIGKQPLLTAQSAPSTSQPLGSDELRARLETEVTKIIQAGHLRPGYTNLGQFLYRELATYFSNPGDTLLSLSMAYPYLSPGLQQQTLAYLQREWSSYFDPTMYGDIGWAEGAARESFPLPPEAQATLGRFPKSQGDRGFSWTYPQHNFYAMWKYAQIDPSKAGRAYDLARSKLQVPVPTRADTAYLRERPFELNAYIAGYYGFLRLQEMAGRTASDAALRTQVTNELNRLFALRISVFSKDTPYLDNYYHRRALNIARNYIFLTPELGDYIRQNDLARWTTAQQEYEYVAPYWFVSRYEAMVSESTISNLYNANALFMARAYILRQPRAELSKYLDAPGFERGDLLYIQNLIAALAAP